ncbi:MAG: divalent-cation tolerance protein CutA [Acidobacteriota bacterium]|jgi:periplasmic divalent cation tolerance protein|nr:divalent-cation tolerance protein CutA [Acidobacteriota bacterium]
MLVVLTTTPNEREAEDLAEKIVAEKLAACVQILPQMKSVYFWDGAVQKESEHLLLIKTLPEKFDVLAKFIQANHSYETPEIAALKAADVSENYFNWIKDSLE